MRRILLLAITSAMLSAFAQPTEQEVNLARRALYCAHLGAKILQLASLPKDESTSRQARGLAAARVLAAGSMSPEEVESQFESTKTQVLGDFRNKLRENELLPGSLDVFVREQSAACAKSREELKQVQ